MLSCPDMIKRFSKYRAELMGFAIIWVMAYHTYTHFDIPLVSWISSFGYLGVEVFLFVSGFGLFMSLHRNGDVKAFYLRRLSRVVIPWLVISFPYWIAKTIIADHEGILRLIANWLGVSFWTQGVTTVWYATFITCLYAFYPLLFHLQGTSKRTIPISVFICMLLLLMMLVAFPEAFHRLEIALTRIPAFLLGSFAGHLLTETDEGDDRSHAICSFITAYAAVGCGLFLFVSFFGLKNEMLRILVLRLSGFGVALYIMNLLCMLLDHCRQPVLGKALSSLGEVSLELYLIHVFLENIVSRLNLFSSFPLTLRLVLAVVQVSLAIVLGFIAHHVLVSNSRLRNRISRAAYGAGNNNATK